MTETRIIVDLDREATPDQIMDMQDGIEASLDHVVFDTLIPDSGYSGFASSFAGNVVTLGGGRLYTAGKVYAGDAGFSQDLTLSLPAQLLRAFVIVGYGQEGDSDPEPVNYVVEAQSTPTSVVYKPQTVATTHKRTAIVSLGLGDPAVNPVQPDFGSAILIAAGVLSPNGIVSFKNFAPSLNPNLADVAKRLAAVEDFDSIIGPEVSTLTAQLAALANSTGSDAQRQQQIRIMLAVADLDAKVGIPATAADADADYLLTGANVDLANAIAVTAGGCKVVEGIRFPDAAASDAALSIFSPYDPGAAKGPLLSGTLMPAYARYLRQSTGPVTGHVLGNAYQFNPVSYTQKTVARTRTRYGTDFDVCSNSVFWNSGVYDPISGIFKLPDGETFKAAVDPNETAATGAGSGTLGGGVIGIIGADGQVYQHEMIRLEQFWTDTVEDTYWDAVVQAPVQINGYHIAESQQIGQDQWLDAVGFFLTGLDTQGDVTVIVCEAAANAAPDPTAVLGMVTIPFNKLVVGENIAPMSVPVLQEAGKRISTMLVTNSGHQFGTTDGQNFPQGTFFYLAPSGFAQGDLTKHLALNFYGCKFAAAAVSVQLNNLQLAGGMTAIDILAGTVVPNSTALVYEVQLNGIWTALSVANKGQLNAGGALPPNVPVRATFVGSPDMMPALNLAQSNAHVSRPATTMAGAYPLGGRQPPVPTSKVHVNARYEAFNPAYHTATAILLTGANGATQTNPSSFTDVVGGDGSTTRTYNFILGAAITSFEVLFKGATASLFDLFHLAKYQDYVE